MTFMSYLSAFVFATIVVLKEGFTLLKTGRFAVLFLRAFFGAVATVLYVISLKYIPLINATLLFNTPPLFVPIFCLFILKIKVPWKVWIAIIIGFIGILFIIRPTFSSLGQPGDILGLGSGISLALAFTMLTILTNTEPTKRINFYFFGIGILLMLPFLFSSQPTSGIENWGWAAATGFFLSCAKSFSSKRTSALIPMKLECFSTHLLFLQVFLTGSFGIKFLQF